MVHPAGGAASPTLSEGVGGGIVLALLAMFLFACMDAVSKQLAADYPIAQILWLRYLFFAGFALLVARRSGFRRTAASRRPWLQTVRSLLLVGEVGVFVLAFRHLPLADVHAIAAAAPLLVTALSVPLLGEPVGIRRWTAVVAGFAGVIIIIRPGLGATDWRILIPVLGALLFALYQVTVRLVSRTDSSETTLLYSALPGAVVTSAVGPFSWQPPDATGWLLLLLVGLLGSLAHFAFIKALQMAPAAALQPFTYTLLIWATVLGFLAFGDFPDRWTILGAAIVAASGLYTFYRERVRRRPSAG